MKKPNPLLTAWQDVMCSRHDVFCKQENKTSTVLSLQHFNHSDLTALPPKSTKNIDIKTMTGNVYTNTPGSTLATHLKSQSFILFAD